ncbi:Uncharacterised protein [uncultured archaeon]|nr:Uncharacterised protein [uncultured archaeon]
MFETTRKIIESGLESQRQNLRYYKNVLASLEDGKPDHDFYKADIILAEKVLTESGIMANSGENDVYVLEDKLKDIGNAISKLAGNKEEMTKEVKAMKEQRKSAPAVEESDLDQVDDDLDEEDEEDDEDEGT